MLCCSFECLLHYIGRLCFVFIFLLVAGALPKLLWFCFHRFKLNCLHCFTKAGTEKKILCIFFLQEFFTSLTLFFSFLPEMLVKY